MSLCVRSLRATPDECHVYRYGKQVFSVCRHCGTGSGPLWPVQRRTTWPPRLGWPTPQSQRSLSRSFPSEWTHQRSGRENSTMIIRWICLLTITLGPRPDLSISASLDLGQTKPMVWNVPCRIQMGSWVCWGKSCSGMACPSCGWRRPEHWH